MPFRIKNLPDTQPVNVVKSLKELSDVQMIVEERIVHTNGSELRSECGKHYVISHAASLPVPFNYIAIECTDCILLDFILADLGLLQLGTFNYSHRGLCAEYRDDYGNIYGITEERSYAMENLL